MRRTLVAVQCSSCSGGRGARCCSNAPITCRSISDRGRSSPGGRPVSRAFRRGLALGAASGLAAVLLAEAMRPRAGSAELLDWDEVTRVAIRRLRGGRIAAAALAEAAVRYNRFAGEVRGPLLEAVGGLPPGVRLPDFAALDRVGWLELNLGTPRQVREP